MSVIILDENDKRDLQEQIDKKAGRDELASQFNFKGTTTVGDLPLEGNEINDTYYCTDAVCNYSWNGTGWYQSGPSTKEAMDTVAAAAAAVEAAKDEMLDELESVGNIVQEAGDSPTAVMSQKAVTNEFAEQLRVIDGNFTPEFEIGTITVNSDGTLAYSASTVIIRTVQGALYRVPQGTSFALSDYTTAMLLLRYSYDGGATFTGVTRKASVPDAVVMAQDAVVAIVIQSATSTKQTDTSLSEFLVVDVCTESEKITERELNSTGLWEMGTFNMTTGAKANSTTTARICGYIHKSVTRIKLNGMTTRLLAWDADGSYVGYWDGTSFQTANASLAINQEIDLAAFREKYPTYQFCIFTNTSSVGGVAVIEFLNKVYSAIDNVAADLDRAETANTNTSDLWEMGTFNMTTGAKANSTTAARIKDFIGANVEKINLNGMTTRLLAWDADGSYVGYWDGTSFQTTNASMGLTRDIDVAAFRAKYPTYQFRIFANASSVDAVSTIEFYGKIHSALYDSKTRKPMVTFVDDDGWAEAIDNWVEIANETGIKPTFAIVTSTVDTDNHATWEQMKRLANRGFEFISHTHTHIRSTDATDEELENEYLTSINAFNDHGLKCEFLAYPYNAYNLRVMNIAKKYFTGAVTNGNVENYLPLVPFGLYRHGITNNALVSKTFADGTTREVYDYRTEEDLRAVIDAAVENNGWVIFMSHSRNRDTFYYNDDIKQMIINLIKHAAKSGCEIVTLKEGYEAYKNRLDLGVYMWDTSYLVVDRDGRVYEK